MPEFGNFIANIEVDKNEVPEYGVRVKDSEKLVSCWVPSEAGKAFSVYIRCKGSNIKTEFSGNLPSIGEIELDVWGDVVDEDIPFPNCSVTSDLKVLERSKKLGAHHVKFDAGTITPSRHRDTTNIGRLATFIFTYRPLDMLQANGIAPFPASAERDKRNNKRKTLEDDADIKKEASDEDDDDIDDRVQKLKDELRRLESRRAKKLKEKKEDLPS
ncbi:hypothetical protein APHAL10511_007639 [Amanita phalloides]|nr:hypothetical protein APHAL10511_007639 [Amanita phalloides]